MKIRANLLMFDKLDRCNYIFPKDCKINVPPTIPITYPDHNTSIGVVTDFKRNDTYISIEAIIHFSGEDMLRKLLEEDENIYVGIYANQIERKIEDHHENIISMHILSVGLYFDDVYGDKSLRLELMEYEQNDQN